MSGKKKGGRGFETVADCWKRRRLTEIGKKREATIPSAWRNGGKYATSLCQAKNGSPKRQARNPAGPWESPKGKNHGNRAVTQRGFVKKQGRRTQRIGKRGRTSKVGNKNRLEGEKRGFLDHGVGGTQKGKQEGVRFRTVRRALSEEKGAPKDRGREKIGGDRGAQPGITPREKGERPNQGGTT